MHHFAVVDEVISLLRRVKTSSPSKLPGGHNVKCVGYKRGAKMGSAVPLANSVAQKGRKLKRVVKKDSLEIGSAEIEPIFDCELLRPTKLGASVPVYFNKHGIPIFG